jgi:small GTP-binding protein
MFAQHIAMSPHKAKKQVRISNVVMEEEFPRKRIDGEEGRTRRNALSAVDANRRLRQASKKEKAFRRSSSRILKVLVVGNASSGKSSLVRRYVHGDFGNIGPTIGADFQRKDVRYGETLYRLQLWDIAGQDRFVHLARAYFKEAAAAIVVCDASRISTILAAEKWLEEIENKVVKADVTVPIILAINKVDLLDVRIFSLLRILYIHMLTKTP